MDNRHAAGRRTDASATLLIILSALLWATMGIFVRNLSTYALSSMQIVAVRALTTVAIMLVAVAIYDASLMRARLRDMWCFLGTGLCSILFFNYCYFRTIKLTSLSVAAVLLYTAPAMVMVLSLLLFREKPNPQRILALVLAFLGCVLATGAGGDGARLTTLGVLTGLGAGLGYALYSIFGRYALQRGYHPLTITAYTFVFASVGVAALVDLPGLAAQVAGQPTLLAWCIGLGIVTTVLPYVLYTIGLQHIESSRASIIASVEPVAATLIGVLLYREGLTPAGAAGVALVILSIVLLSADGRGQA